MNTLRRLLFCTLALAITLLPTTAGYSQSTQPTSGWTAYINEEAGFQLLVPPQAHLTAGQNAADPYPTVNLAFSLPGAAGYQGMVIETLPNPDHAAPPLALNAPALVPAQVGQVDGFEGVLPERGTQITQVAAVGDVLYLLAEVIGPNAEEVDPAALDLFRQIAATLQPLDAGPSGKRMASGAAQADSSSSTMQPQASDVFFTPLGTADSRTYAPHILYDGSGNLIEDTRYGVKNPDLYRPYTCFGPSWDQIYHAGVDLYRVDGQSAYGAQVTAVADGLVEDFNPAWNYPGEGVVVKHWLTSGQPIYSVYMHVENVAVVIGQPVSRGQVIGTVLYQPYTGQYPAYHLGQDDSHLHFEMRFFADARQVYAQTGWWGCDLGDKPGRGYTYPDLPDNFPTYASGYRDPLKLFERPIPIMDKHLFVPFCSADLSCAVVDNLLDNGGFEDGARQSAWSLDGVELLVSSDDPRLPTGAHEGRWLAWLGGRDSANDRIWQSVDLPQNAASLSLTYWTYLRTAELADGKDEMRVVLRSGQGNEVRVADVMNAAFPIKDRWVQRTVDLSDLSPTYAGQTLRLSFESTTDNVLKSDFFVDEVQLSAGTCAP